MEGGPGLHLVTAVSLRGACCCVIHTEDAQARLGDASLLLTLIHRQILLGPPLKGIPICRVLIMALPSQII